MAETTIKPYNLSVAKNIIGPLAQTNHFQVTFSSLRPSVETYLKSYLRVDDVRNFLSRRAGILCDSASLPTTAYATAEVRDNFMGVPQQFAHTRIYTDLDYYRRMRYPDSYKCDTMYINKFEKNFKKTLRYRFVNVFPKAMSAIPVQYGPADLLKVSISFNFDRYIVNG